ncbi:hypothetical protein GCM10010404_92100 [Nonomuraea africana]
MAAHASGGTVCVRAFALGVAARLQQENLRIAEQFDGLSGDGGQGLTGERLGALACSSRLRSCWDFACGPVKEGECVAVELLIQAVAL